MVDALTRRLKKLCGKIGIYILCSHPKYVCLWSWWETHGENPTSSSTPSGYRQTWLMDVDGLYRPLQPQKPRTKRLRSPCRFSSPLPSSSPGSASATAALASAASICGGCGCGFAASGGCGCGHGAPGGCGCAGDGSYLGAARRDPATLKKW